ncbi:hypothetical protein ACFQH2_01400 [Natronoarchaeum sp. GCM10025703]|uniref:hypothetical protein n=1 Tax=unclassified Natronoarchaeum TaxID=2620183 RepID=UPI00360D25A2
MSEPLRVASGELSMDELVATLNEGQRVIVETEMLGSTYDVTLRFDGGTYYCDTPTTLHKHDDEAEMRECIRRFGYSTD